MRYAPLFLLLLLGACGTGYHNNGRSVTYKTWNEGSGGHSYALNADPGSFRDLGHGYAKDRKTVWYEGAPLPLAEPASFAPVGDYCGRDAYHAWQGEKLIRGAKGASFRMLNDYEYSTDGHDVFYDTSALHVADVAQFRILTDETTEHWASDGHYYYYNQFRVPSDDYAHVTRFPNSGGIAKDLHYVYISGQKMNYDMDGKRVVDTIDAASFTVTGYLECHDRWGCFNPYHGREACTR